jgi:peptidoglycan/xylan/chitin deacetylase (PgdA/CDA1 family)
VGNRPGRTKQWLADRPGLVTLVALLAPALISLTGLGVVSLLPDIHNARVSLPRISLGPLGLAHPDVTAAPTPVPEMVPPGRAEIRVPVLEYHYVRVNPVASDRLGFNLSVTPPDFAAQMDWLDARGYHPVDLNDLRAYFQTNLPLPARPVVLTFDDGYADFYTAAFPVLQAHGFKAVSYIVPGFLGRPNYMTPEQVNLIDQGGIEVAAHTMHHVDLKQASPAARALEIGGSRTVLEQMVGHPVLDFCYPSGQYDANVIAAVMRAGFQSATTEVPGTRHTWANRMTWTRVRVMGGEQLDQFAASLDQPEVTATASPPPPA